MEQKKILYMGIDLTDEQAMVSLFGRGMEEPETIMTGASNWMKQRVNRSFIRDCFVSLSSGSFS